MKTLTEVTMIGEVSNVQENFTQYFLKIWFWKSASKFSDELKQVWYFGFYLIMHALYNSWPPDALFIPTRTHDYVKAKANISVVCIIWISRSWWARQQWWFTSSLRRRPRVTLSWTHLRWCQPWSEPWQTATTWRLLDVLRVPCITSHITDRVCWLSSSLVGSQPSSNC